MPDCTNRRQLHQDCEDAAGLITPRLLHRAARAAKGTQTSPGTASTLTAAHRCATRPSFLINSPSQSLLLVLQISHSHSVRPFAASADAGTRVAFRAPPFRPRGILWVPWNQDGGAANPNPEPFGASVVAAVLPASRAIHSHSAASFPAGCELAGPWRAPTAGGTGYDPRGGRAFDWHKRHLLVRSGFRCLMGAASVNLACTCCLPRATQQRAGDAAAEPA